MSLTVFVCDVTAGLFTTGAALKRLGSFYARAILDAGLEYDVLFGPAYKVQDHTICMRTPSQADGIADRLDSGEV